MKSWLAQALLLSAIAHQAVAAALALRSPRAVPNRIGRTS